MPGVDTRAHRARSIADVYERHGARAISVARALTADCSEGDRIVVEAFAEMRQNPDAVLGAIKQCTTEYNAILQFVVARFEQCEYPSPRPRTNDVAGTCQADNAMPRDCRVALVLTTVGGCLLDDVAKIVGVSRLQVARALRAGLHWGRDGTR